MAKIKTDSDNLKKLRKIVKVLESQDFQFEIDGYNTQYKDLTEKIDILVHNGLKNLEFEKDNKNKLQCYESLFASIIILLEGVKQVV